MQPDKSGHTANQIVARIPHIRININALDNAPKKAPKVLSEYKVPTSRPTKELFRETYLLKIGRVAPIKDVGMRRIAPQMKNLYKLALEYDSV